MERTISEMQKRLETALAEIGKDPNPVLRYGRSVAAVRVTIDELKAFVQANPFAGMREEIFYFRELAPGIYSRLFYFMKLHQVESLRPCSSTARFRQTLESELEGIETFFLRHNDICRYYYQQTRYWDEQLFTRHGRANWPVDDISIVLDADFSLGSYWVSWIRANERYRGWLEGELRALARAEAEAAADSLSPKRGVRGLSWAGSKTDLVELIYGLHRAGSFGEVTIKKVVDEVQDWLGIDLGNVSITWQEIARRKKVRTKFLDEVREGLVRRLEDTD